MTKLEQMADKYGSNYSRLESINTTRSTHRISREAYLVGASAMLDLFEEWIEDIQAYNENYTRLHEAYRLGRTTMIQELRRKIEGMKK